MEVFERDAEEKLKAARMAGKFPMKREEFKKVQEAFTERVAEIDRPKFTTHDIGTSSSPPTSWALWNPFSIWRL